MWSGRECACRACSPPVFLFGSQRFGRATILDTRHRTRTRQAAGGLSRDDRFDCRHAS
ncbi:hypothetical protein P355_0024 [Burkholderia cenocepacia KC-01]|nr:hypothetical protein P355_0024 [Burkholderia cenocepacia KC-01]